MRRFLLVLGVASVAWSTHSAAAEEARFRRSEEQRVDAADLGDDERAALRGDEPELPSNLEDRLYLSERPDAIGAAAIEWHDAQLENLLRDREGLVVERRNQAISLLEEFVAEEPENTAEMADALLRLAELRWESARANYLTEFAAWQGQAEGSRGREPRPDYTVALELYDRLIEHHPDFDRIDFVLYLKAFALTESGDAEGALALYRQILSRFPDSRFVPDAHMALAEFHFANLEYPEALGEFEQVMQYRDSELYDMALFKSAWCLWRMDRTRDAATRFRQVLDLGNETARLSNSQRRRLRELQSEALDYLIQVFTEDESNTAEDVFRFLDEIGGERYASRVLMRLSLRYMDDARFDQGIAAYRLLLQAEPANENAPLWQQQIASAYAAMDEPGPTIEALDTLANEYLTGSEWAQQQSDPEVVSAAKQRIERAIRVRAMRWHELGQRDDSRARFEQAERAYAIYLEHFPDSDQAYDLHFYRGEILFHRLERFPEAGDEYLEAAELEPGGEHTRDALYNAIGAFEHVREEQLEDCQRGRQGRDRPARRSPRDRPRARGATAENEGSESDAESESDPAASADPCGETTNDVKFGHAIELYVELFPNDPDLPEILFRQGRFYYDRGVYDPAVRLFGQLLERFPQSEYATTAGELILDSFNRAQDYANIEQWARRLKEAPAFRSAASQARLDTLILQAVFAVGEQLAGRGQHAEAAEAFERAALEFPRDPRARQALYNAGLERQRAGDLSGAANTYERLIELHPGSAEGALAAWSGAQMMESIAQFSDAARFHEANGTRFPESEHAVDSLYNAVLLRLAAEEWQDAVRASEAFLERYPRHELADEVNFLLAKAHEGAERWRQAVRVYTEYARRSRSPDRDIEAQTRLAQTLMRAGDREAADHALTAAVRTGQRSRSLEERGRYWYAQARFLQGERILEQFNEIEIAGPTSGLRRRLERKSELLRDAATAFSEVVELRVAEFVTAALFKIGRAYELFAAALRDAPIPEGLNEDEEQAYLDQLAGFVIPIEEEALQAFEGGYETAMNLQIYNTWTEQLRDGLTRLNDVQYPPFREMGADIVEDVPLPPPSPFDGLRRDDQTGAGSAEEPSGEAREARARRATRSARSRRTGRR